MRRPAARGALAQNSIALVCSREPHPAPALPRESAARPAGSLAGDLLAFLGPKVSRLTLLSGTGAFQPHGAVDDAQMAIGLWEVAERRPGDRVVAFREQSEG